MGMNMRILTAVLLGTAAHCGTAYAADGQTQASEDSSGTDEIIVTAQKREERLRDVPMSITAVSGEQLERRGVTNIADLAKVVPGLTFQSGDFGSPIYTIRGVGQKDNGVAVFPTVSTYIDQVVVPFSVETLGTAFDLERVEVLKGPQGTLFGQNSTGGAINFIAAKPTKSFAAGLQTTYGRFGQFDAQGYISGPLADTLSARIAIKTEQRGDWQTSQTRNDSLGERHFTTGRLLLDWQPSDNLRFQFNANGWIDKSDTVASQYVAMAVIRPGGYADVLPQIAAYSPAPDKARIADWDPNADYRRDDRFGLLALRADLDISDDVKLTSITSYSGFKQFAPMDTDGVNVNDMFWTIKASIKSFSQELRLAGNPGPLRWMVGANYQKDNTKDAGYMNYHASNSGVGPFRYDNFYYNNNQDVTTKSVFGSLNYEITDSLTAQGSMRYTKSDNDASGCIHDSGDGQIATAFSLFTILSGRPIPPGQCVTLSEQFLGVIELPPGSGNFLPQYNGSVPIISKSLNEDNVSWRAGLNWKPNSDTMLYFNATKGYKAGSFSTIPSLFPSQYDPAKQESVLALEGGFKADLADRTVNISGAVFFYDYQNKQLAGFKDTLFGNLPALISIPKSKVLGAELNLSWKPVPALVFSGGVTYVKSEVISDFVTNDPLGAAVNIKGESFPSTPEWQAVADVQYNFPLGGDLNGFAGAGVSYRGKSWAAFGLSPLFRINEYALLDLRAGVESDRWKVEIWGRNVTNKFYVNTVTHITDTVARVVGMPATYGVTVGYKFK